MDFPWFLSLQWWLTYLLTEYEKEPGHVLLELSCILIIVYLVFSKSYDPKKADTRMSKREEDELIEEWHPVPLCPPLSEEQKEIEAFPIVESGTGPYIVVGGKKLLNMASFNFLGLADNKDSKAAAAAAIEKYGVGSCGPRGFYGTIDVHLEFENSMAKFMGLKDAILYSDGLACVSSIIPAFAKRGDLIICDEGINYGAQQGISLSRCNVLFFKHNDMEDLELVLKNVQEREMKNPKGKSSAKRRFIVIEGIYQYYGDIAPLDKLVALKNKYKYRLVLDDSLAVGVLGKTGRGTTEHCNVPVEDIDFLAVTADNAIATTGGFCLGSPVVVDHQRLSGAGYCFSASSPPFCSAAGVCNLGIMDKQPELGAECRRKAALLRAALQGLDGVTIPEAKDSPLIHIRLQRSMGSHLEDFRHMRRVVKLVREAGIILEVPAYIPTDKQPPAPSIRINVTVSHDDEDLRRVASTLKQAFAKAQTA